MLAEWYKIAAMEDAPNSTPETKDESMSTADIAPTPTAVSSSKAGAIAKSILAVLLGGGSIFSVIQWAVKGPEYERKLEALKVDQAAQDIRDKQVRQEWDQRKMDIDSRIASLGVIEKKMALLKTAHDEEIESLKRDLNHSNDEQLAKSLAAQLAERERAYRTLLQQLEPVVVMQSVGAEGALARAVSQSGQFEKSMLTIAKGWNGSTGARSPAGNRTEMEQPVMEPNSRAWCVPADSKVDVHVLDGSDDYVASLFGYLDFPAIPNEGLERLSPHDRRVSGTLSTNGVTGFTTEGASRDKCYMFEIQDIKIQKKPLKSLQDEGALVVGDFTQIPDREIVYKDALAEFVMSNLPQGFKVIVAWGPIPKN